MVEDKSNEKYEKLLVEYRDQREALKILIDELEKLKKDIDKLFPDRLDKRYLGGLFDQKIKAATEMFKAILELRKEIAKNVKDEFEMRRKLDNDINETTDSNVFDVRKAVKLLQEDDNLVVLRKKSAIN